MPQCTCDAEWDGYTQGDHQRGCAWYDAEVNDEAMRELEDLRDAVAAINEPIRQSTPKVIAATVTDKRMLPTEPVGLTHAKGGIVKSTIPAGVGTKYGIIVSILTLAKPVIDQIVALFENTQANWGTADKTSLIAGAVVAGVTLIGRFAQAAVKLWRGESA